MRRLLWTVGVLWSVGPATLLRPAAPHAQVLTSSTGRVIREMSLRLPTEILPLSSEACRGTLGDGGYVVTTASPTVICPLRLPTLGHMSASIRYEITERLRQGPLDRDFGLSFGDTDTPNRFFTFSVRGDGVVRLDQSLDRKWSELVKPAVHAAVNRGYAATNTLAVEIRGTRIVGFVNGQRVADVQASSPVTGFVGMYLDTGGLEVVFSDLRITEIGGSPGPLSTSAKSSPILLAKATQIYFDDLSTNQVQFVGANEHFAARYANGGYELESRWDAAAWMRVLDFKPGVALVGRVDVTARLLAGSPATGFGLRMGSGDGDVRFLVSSSGMRALVTKQGETFTTVLPWETASAVRQGFDVANRLALEFRDRAVRCFVNDIFVGEAQLPGSVGREVALFVGLKGSKAVFNNLTVYDLVRDGSTGEAFTSRRPLEPTRVSGTLTGGSDRPELTRAMPAERAGGAPKT